MMHPGVFAALLTTAVTSTKPNIVVFSPEYGDIEASSEMMNNRKRKSDQPLIIITDGFRRKTKKKRDS